MWLWVSNCTGGETVKQSTFGTGQGLLHILNIYNTGPISLAQKCSGGETVKHSTSPIAKGKGMFHSLNMHNTNWIFNLIRAKLTRKLGLPRIYLLHTYKSSSRELINMFHAIPVGSFQENRQKKHTLIYFGAEKGTEICPTGAILHLKFKNTYNMSVNHVWGSGIINLLSKWRKTSGIVHFDLFFGG